MDTSRKPLDMPTLIYLAVGCLLVVSVQGVFLHAIGWNAYSEDDRFMIRNDLPEYAGRPPFALRAGRLALGGCQIAAVLVAAAAAVWAAGDGWRTPQGRRAVAVAVLNVFGMGVMSIAAVTASR